MTPLSALLLFFLILFLSPSPTSSLLPFVLQTAQAQWPARLVPAWQTTTRSITSIDLQGNPQTYRPGSMILYGGVNSNDIWITRAGANVGRQWDLIGGIVRNFAGQQTAAASSPFERLSFTPRFEAATCEDPTDDRAYIISGGTSESLDTTDLVDNAWRTDDGREWTSLGRLEVPPRTRSSCVVLHDSSVVVTAGLDKPYQTRTGYIQDAYNDVWRSTSAGNEWVQQTAAASWASRSRTLLLASPSPARPERDFIFLLGGNSNRGNNIFYNDVWASSDNGASWTVITEKAPWAARWGHSGVVTRDGVIVFFGGTVRDDYFTSYNDYNFAYYGDTWASFDGGYTWKECGEGRNPNNRTEAAVTLDNLGYLMMAAGMQIPTTRSQGAAPVVMRTQNVVRSSYSLERDDNDEYDGGRQFARMCGIDYPASGPGLRVWPTERWNSNGGAVAGLVLMALFITILFFGYLYTKNSVQQHGAFQWPTANSFKEKVLAVSALPDVSFLTNLPLADQFRQTGEGQPNNNLSEGLLGERESQEEATATA